MYTSKERQIHYQEPVAIPTLIDPTVIRAARQIYRTFIEIYPNRSQQPTGVVINRFTYRGKLIFSAKPILLPDECFVPLNQIEIDTH
ncbi:hypothetical protein [Merismopedia glauca]|uniref:Uncharacterized protein n=1 Tax=Merismopedia glauca CCAP 1448/3 TaxID=1296344 RepID=A0A2T1CA48_9CYAN|nr:hypothetical protein [Merismopedia glauca]PSB05121.1 hypothetical protein C7B64_01050 [Merismopedia glauca CCAP 1448/3]